MYSYIEVNNKNSAPFSWKGYHQLVKKLLDIDSSMPLFYNPSEKAFRQMILSRNQYSKGNFKTFLFLHHTDCIGILELMLKPQMAYLSILPHHTNTELIDCIGAIYHSCNLNALRITTSQKEVADMLQKGGSKLLIHDVIQALKREEVVIEELHSLTDIGRKYIERQGFVLKTFHKLEEDILTQYVAFHNEVIRDILVYDMENGVEEINPSTVKEKCEEMLQMGGGFLYLLLFDSKGNIIGLTEVWIADLEDGSRVNSGLTAIKKEHRKRGLAQFLKAKMIQKFLADSADFKILETANSVVNIPVLKLNEKFGFQQVGEEFMLEFKQSLLG